MYGLIFENKLLFTDSMKSSGRKLSLRSRINMTLYYILIFALFYCIVGMAFFKLFPRRVVLSTLCANTALGILFYIGFYRNYNDTYRNRYYNFTPDNVRDLIYVLMLLLLGCILSQLTTMSIVSNMGDKFFKVYQSSIRHETSLYILLTLLFAPWAEEVLMRGYLFNSISHVTNKKTGYILNILIFVCLHATIVHIYTATIGGLILTYVYDKTDKISVSVLFHFLFNFFALMLSRISVPVIFLNPLLVLTVDIIYLVYIVKVIKKSKYMASFANKPKKYDYKPL